MRIFFLAVSLSYSLFLFGQGSVTRDIKSFGAKGDGRTNDHEAFQRAAAFFNQRGGNGKLIISKGTYLVGKQTFNRNTTKAPVYEGEDLLKFTGVKNLVIEGVKAPVIRYRPGLRFGSFDKKTGDALSTTRDFYDYASSAVIKNAIDLNNCENVEIRNLELDGNNGNIILGGAWGDVGRQLYHSGIQLENSKKITCTNVNVHHFGLDGIRIFNDTREKQEDSKITIANSRFEYNGRQGLSWVGGRDLTVIKSAFNHTGKGKFVSPPGAGVDIEPAEGYVRNGKFIDCEFINNTGCGLIADSGPSSDCTFTRCLFWGTTAWSIWIKKPGFTIEDSKIYGSVVHGYDAKTDSEATKFINCHFEDKPYKGAEAYGTFLIESNGAKRMRFENCTMVANKKKLVWMAANPGLKPEEKYQLINCRLLFLGGKPPADNWVAAIRSVNLKNNTFEIKHPKGKEYYFTGLQDSYNVKGGSNKIIVNGAARQL